MYALWNALSLATLLLFVHVMNAEPLGRQKSYATLIQRHGSQWSPETFFYSAGSEGFQNATERWTTYEAPTYQGAVRPTNEQDLAQIVQLASELNIPFLATGGRHGYTTTIGDLEDGLAIDLSLLDSMSIDNSTGKLTVGPGVRFGSIFEPLFDAGYDIQTGSAPCPSVIGVTLGGGAGRYQGSYGLLIDALESVRLVTADGDIVEASTTENADLFWAIRGAGANFGIVVSATYQAHPLTDDGDVFEGVYRVPAGRETEYFQLLESLQPLDENLSSLMFMNYNQSSNETQVQTQWVYKGREAAARAALKPIHDFGLSIDNEAMTQWNRLVADSPGIDLVCAPKKKQNIYSWNMKSIDAASYTDAFKRMNNFFENQPKARGGNLQFELFSNRAMAAVPSDATAFPWRESTGQVHFNIVSPDSDAEVEAASNEFGLELRRRMIPGAGFDDVTVFVTFAHGDEPIERIYGEEKLPRLAALKAKWDPKQVFSFNNGLPSKYP